MPARVLHLIPSLGPGGSERQLVYLANHLPDLGWDVHIGLVRQGASVLQASHRVTVHRLPVASNHDPRLFLLLQNLVRRVQPNLVQTWLRQMDLTGGLVARANRLPWVLSERSTAKAYPPSVKHRARELLARHCATVIANSEMGRRYWLGQRLPARVRLEVIPNAIDLDQIQAALPVDLRQEGLDPHRPVLLVAGRLEAEKNLPTLIKALPEVLSACDGVVVFCGDGYQRAEIQSLVQESGLIGRAIFKGVVRNLWSWLKSARLAISVSLYEGCANVVLEAMACRCPLVVSDIAGHRDCLGQDGAIFVDPQDPRAIARGVLECLADPDQAAVRADRAASGLCHRSPGECAWRYHRLYQEILAQPQADNWGLL